MPKMAPDNQFTAEQIAAFRRWLNAKRERESKAAEQSPKPCLKDRVFTFLFSEVENQIELYRALHPEEPAPTADEIVLVTLQSVISTHPYNDLGLFVRGRVLILVEAQSSWSVNIVLRALMYLTRTWSDLLTCTGANLYGSKAVTLPKSESYVVFTGTRSNKAEWLSLRDIYFPNDDCHLDFKVQCIYKNDGGTDIIQQYIAFAEIWDKLSQKFGKDHQMDALRETIELCIKYDILTKFFTKRRAEIMDIYTALFDQEEVTRRTNLQYWEEGKEEERKEIARAMKKNGISQKQIEQCTGLTPEQINAL